MSSAASQVVSYIDAQSVSPLSAMWRFDCAMREGKAEYIVGVDEAGRGCLAGPIFAAAVILSSPVGLSHVDDSKKLSTERREVLAAEIKARAFAWAVASASVREIDRRGIDWANRIVFTRAVRKLQQHLPLGGERTHVLVDGIRPAYRCPW